VKIGKLQPIAEVETPMPKTASSADAPTDEQHVSNESTRADTVPRSATEASIGQSDGQRTDGASQVDSESPPQQETAAAQPLRISAKLEKLQDHWRQKSDNTKKKKKSRKFRSDSDWLLDEERARIKSPQAVTAADRSQEVEKAVDAATVCNKICFAVCTLTCLCSPLHGSCLKMSLAKAGTVATAKSVSDLKVVRVRWC